MWDEQEPAAKVFVAADRLIGALTGC